MTGRTISLTLLATCLLAHPAPAQSPQGPQNPTARAGGFSAAVEMVRVPVVVVDEDGDFVRGLARSNFAIRDGGTLHTVQHFVSDAEPSSVGIIVDSSALMSSYTDQVRQAVMRAANNLRADDELFLITYAERATLISPPSPDKSAFAMALVKYAPAGPDRALFDAVELGMQTLSHATYDKRTLILIGAGADTCSHVGELTLQQDIHRAGVAIHAIVVANRPRRARANPSRINRVQTIPEIALFTGGMVAYRPANAARFGGISGWLEAAGADISTYVKHQYLLHYAPLNPPRPGTWREIRVRVDVDFELVRARSGYIR